MLPDAHSEKQGKDMSNEATYRKLAHEMIMAGVNAADPRQSIKDSVKI